MSTGARVRVQIMHKGEVFEAFARVVNTRSNSGLGVFFTNIEEHHQVILGQWVAGLRSGFLRMARRSLKKSCVCGHGISIHLHHPVNGV